jgi:hypothetical protein
MEDLMNRSGAPRRLRDVDVTEESLEMLARDAMLQTRLLGNNPVDVTEADAPRALSRSVLSQQLLLRAHLGRAGLINRSSKALFRPFGVKS